MAGVRTRPAILVATLLIALSGACGSRSDDGVSTQDEGTTTTRADDGAGSDGTDVDNGTDEAGDDTDADASDGSAAGSGSGSGGDAGPGEAPPAPTASGAVKPARPGTYLYDVEGTVTQSGALGGSEPMPTPATLTVDPADGGRQRSVLDERDTDGDGSVTTSVLQFRDDGVFLESLKLQTKVSGITITYEFRPDPPQLLAPTGAGVGYHTEFTMTSTNGGLRTTTVLDVVGEETVTIGGAAVDTFKVVTHTTVEGDADGESTSTTNFARDDYLSVREHTVSDLQTSFGRIQSDGTATLRSTTPRS